MPRWKIGLIYGGRSGEHEVSLQTARACMHALDREKYEIFLYYIDRQGSWYATAESVAEPPDDVDALRLDSLEPSGQHMIVSGAQAVAGLFSKPAAVDIVFPLLHGTYGEDGTIQGLLEMAGIPYVGAGVLASAAGMDKDIMKKLFIQAGLPVGPYQSLTATEWAQAPAACCERLTASLTFPCFVKPANSGSSVGIRKVTEPAGLSDAIEYAFRFDQKLVIESGIDGREIEVSILGNEHPQVSVPGEIVSANDFYDYRAKYIDGTSQMIVPAELDEPTKQKVQQLAILAYQAIGATGLSRVDFFLRRSDGALLLNEINTMPGFTPFSMYPVLWKESGLSYTELLDQLVALAFERFHARQSLEIGIEDELA